MMWRDKDPDEIRDELEQAAEIEEEIAGPEVEEKVADNGLVAIEYLDGRTNKVTPKVAVALVARGIARVV